MNNKRKHDDDADSSKRGRKSDDKKPLEPSHDESRWPDLPPIAVEKIYGYLNSQDQLNMSRVCRNWNRELDSPSLWRKFEFLVPKRHLNLEEYPEVLFARKYGHWCRHGEIVFKEEVEWCHKELIWKQVKLFLEALAFHGPTLETVKFLCNTYFICDRVSRDVHHTIKKFLSSQHSLKTVEIRNLNIKQSEEAEILRVIFRQNSKSIQNVTLVDDEHNFDLHRDGDDYKITENVGNEAIYESLLNMKTLQLNYSQFFRNIMIAFYEYIKNSDSRRTSGSLELIEIVFSCARDPDFHDRYHRKIPPEFWKLLTKICPSLRLNLNLSIEEYASELRNVIDFYVGPTMPLKKLIVNLAIEMTMDDDDNGDSTAIGAFFRHLESRVSKEYLEDLTVNWPRQTSSLAIDLTGFLETFQKLKNLDIYTDEETTLEELRNPNFSRTHFITERNVRITVLSSVRVHLINIGETGN